MCRLISYMFRFSIAGIKIILTEPNLTAAEFINIFKNFFLQLKFTINFDIPIWQTIDPNNKNRIF